MVRVMGPGLFGFAVFSVWIYSIFDVIATEPMLARNLPKNVWLFVVLFFPGVGGIAWIALGRPLNAGWRPGDTAVRQRRPVQGFEDSAAWNSAGQSSGSTERFVPKRPMDDADDTKPFGTTPVGQDPGTGPPKPRSGESPAVRERRLMEWEAELQRREAELGDAASPDNTASPDSGDQPGEPNT